MKLTTQAEQVKVFLQALQTKQRAEIIEEAKHESSELYYNLIAYVTNINNLQGVIDLLDTKYEQEQMDEFYGESHNSLEILEYTMKSIITNSISDTLYDDFIELFLEEFIKDFNFKEAEIIAHDAIQEGKSFKLTYAISVLDQMIDMCKTWIADYTACETVNHNARTLMFITDILSKIK